ncbi:uncharacterized protein J4E79_003585 [Alternaria viburni]|uniref:uncharacterized protein n=1 Tax=Alternaria viburni TaxID=566460 RepID=UPI0020C4ED1F|nr:uncharacterized protein J4E79_003585 [Alternaria viburni]KAI4664084.1 hypothetical protein J4E79_003585 [Alternaria viburni]
MRLAQIYHPVFAAEFNEIADLFEAGELYPAINKAKELIDHPSRPMYHKMLSWVILALALDHLDVIKICCDERYDRARTPSSI